MRFVNFEKIEASWVAVFQDDSGKKQRYNQSSLETRIRNLRNEPIEYDQSADMAVLVELQERNKNDPTR